MRVQNPSCAALEMHSVSLGLGFWFRRMAHLAFRDVPCRKLDERLDSSRAWQARQLSPDPASASSQPASSAQVSATLLHFSRKPLSSRQISVPPGGVSNQSEVWHLFLAVCCYSFQIAESLNTISLIASADLWPLSRTREILSQAVVKEEATA